jgi:hypothetical protein
VNVTEQGFARNGKTEIYCEVFDHRGFELREQFFYQRS